MHPKDKLRKSDGPSNEFTSTFFVEETLGHSLADFERFDIANPEHLSLPLQQIMELEVSGRILSTDADSVIATELTNTTVRRSLLRLPKIERAVIEGYYADGKTVNQIGTELGISAVTVNNVRLRAVDHFKSLFIEEKKKAGVTADYNLCPVCNCPNLDAIEEYVHIWLDANNWNFFGLTVLVKKEFGIKVVQAQLIEHTEYHMVLEGDRVVQTVDPQLKKPKNAPGIVLVLPIELKEEIEQLAFPYNVTYSEAIRQALKIGVIKLKSILKENTELEQAQFEATRLFKRVKV